jgi:hypothetical protein
MIDSISVDGFWSSWSSWAECQCIQEGTPAGSKSRTRTCIEPRHGGDDCEGITQQKTDCARDDCMGKMIRLG